jgi:hypothetical protein
MSKIEEKSKTTLLINKTLKKLAQVYAIQHETTLQAVVEKGLQMLLMEYDGGAVSKK